MTTTRAETELERFVTSRLVTSLDALPVPPNGRRLERHSVAGARSEPLVVLAVAFALIATALAWGPASHAVADAARLIQRIVIGPPFVGYYFDLRPPDAEPKAGQRIAFAPGTLPGVRTVPEVAGPNVMLTITGPSGGSDGSWTEDGERLLLWAGARIYVGDRSGRVLPVADLGDGHTVLRAGWLRSGEILAVLGPGPNEADRSRWISRIRIGSPAEVPRRVPGPITVWGVPPASPDGRWLTVDRGRGTCTRAGFGASGVYDIDQERIVDLVDGAGRPLMALGWMRDGRLASAFCDAARGTMELFVAPPDTAPTGSLATVAWSRGSPQPFVDVARDRVIVAPGGGVEPATLLAVGLDGRRTELGRLPAVASRRGELGPLLQIVYLRSISRDERYVSFSVTDANDWRRTGVVELATGQVVYACPESQECYQLTLR
jgi:hypothetical protein